MKSRELQELSRAVNELAAKPGTASPKATIPLISSVAPHLTDTEIAELLLQARTQSVWFIGPPTWIRGAEHVYWLRRDRDTPVGRLNPIRLRINATQGVRCNRRPESYVATNFTSRREEVFKNAAYRERVADYAELNYGDELKWDRGVEYIQFIVLACTSETTLGEPSHTGVASFSVPLEQMRTSSIGRCPTMQAWDECLLLATSDDVKQAELLGSVAPKVFQYCGYCGGGIAWEMGCCFCHRKSNFSIMGEIWREPLSINLCRRFEWRCPDVFRTPPINAVKHAYSMWGRDYNRPALQPPGRADRVITLEEPHESQTLNGSEFLQS